MLVHQFDTELAEGVQMQDLCADARQVGAAAAFVQPNLHLIELLDPSYHLASLVKGVGLVGSPKLEGPNTKMTSEVLMHSHSSAHFLSLKPISGPAAFRLRYEAAGKGKPHE